MILGINYYQNQQPVGAPSYTFLKNASTTLISISGALFDKDGQAGTSGQVLSTTGTATDWVAQASGSLPAQLGQIGDVSTSSPMTYGLMLRYNTANSEWESVATSTININTDNLVQGSTNLFNQTHSGDVSGATTLTIGAIKVLDTMINFGTGATQVNTADVSELTNLYYTDARVNTYIHASSTIPKIYTSQSFGGTQTFTNAPVLTSLATAAGTFLAVNGTGTIIATTTPSGGGIADLLGEPLTKGYFLVGDDAGLSQATSTIFISSTGKIGIGTTTPNNSLTVNGNIDITKNNYYKYNDVNMFSASTTKYTYFLAGSGGPNALANLSEGNNDNIGIGYQALYSLTSGGSNQAIGKQALYSATSSVNNTAIGEYALMNIIAGVGNEGNSNIAIGDKALMENTTGYDNTAIGDKILQTNTTGYRNVGIGSNAMSKNTTGYSDIAIGYLALQFNTTGYGNIGIGQNALLYNQTGNNNVIIGQEAGYGTLDNSFSNSVLIGYRAGFTGIGSNNIILGHRAGDNLTTGSNNIIIGYDIDATSTTMTNGLNIGNLIFATGIDGTGTTLSTGNVGIGTTSPYSLLSVGNTPGFGVDSSGNVNYGAWKATAIGTQWGGTGLNLSASTGLIVLNSGVASAVATSSNGLGLDSILRFSFYDNNATTTWSATSSRIFVAAGTEIWRWVQCNTSAGTLNAVLVTGSTYSNVLNASTTVGRFNFSTNNSFTNGTVYQFSAGTPASSPTQLECIALINRKY